MGRVPLISCCEGTKAGLAGRRHPKGELRTLLATLVLPDVLPTRTLAVWYRSVQGFLLKALCVLTKWQSRRGGQGQAWVRWLI